MVNTPLLCLNKIDISNTDHIQSSIFSFKYKADILNLLSSPQHFFCMQCKINVRSILSVKDNTQPNTAMFTFCLNLAVQYYHTQVYKINTLYSNVIIFSDPSCNSINSMLTKLCKTVHD